jgi:outer membrane biosynthesis protein TonB
LSSRRSTERRRAALAAAVSLALHALLLAALLLGREPRRELPPQARLVVTLAPPPRAASTAGAVPVEEPTEAPAPATGPPRPPGPPPLALREAQGERRDGSPAELVPRRDARPAEMVSRRDGSPAETARADGRSRSDLGREPAPDPGGVLGAPDRPAASASTGPDASTGPGVLAPVLPRLGGEAGGGAPLAPAPGRGGLAPESAAEASARGKRRLDAWLGDLVAIDRARNAPETYWSAVRGALERGPAVDWKVLDQGGSEDAVVSGTRAAQLVGGWQRAAEAWARRGRPTAAPRGGGPVPDADARLSLAARGLLDAARPENRLFVTELVTRVLVTVGDDGAVLSIALAESSGNAAHDRLVLARAEALHLASLTLGAPPRSERRTLWTVRTRFELVPPVPVVGCGFDATFRLTGCVYPLKQLVHTDVRLEAVWDGGG